MRSLALVLWAAQVLGAGLSCLASAVEVETIIFSGPVLSITGLLLAGSTRRLNSWWSIAFGLSAPLVCALGATMIALGELSPREAERPITALLGAYCLIGLPLAAASLVEIVRWTPITPAQPGLAWKFSMRTLLIWMTVACVLAAAGTYVFRGFTIVGIGNEGYIFLSFAVLAALLSAAILWRFLAKRRDGKASNEPPGLSRR